jgi:hypothetical protein
MRIRHAEETSDYTAAWEILYAVEQNVQQSRKQKELLLKEQVEPKIILWAKAEFSVIDTKDLWFLLEKHKKDLSC